jgi:hypothetical protein
MKVALDDSFDPSAFLVAGIFAGLSMAQKQYSSFGTGAQGFSKYYGGAFADQTIGNIMSEGLISVAHKFRVAAEPPEPDCSAQLRAAASGRSGLSRCCLGPSQG